MYIYIYIYMCLYICIYTSICIYIYIYNVYRIPRLHSPSQLLEVSGDLRRFLLPAVYRGKPFSPADFRRKAEPVPLTQVLSERF